MFIFSCKNENKNGNVTYKIKNITYTHKKFRNTEYYIDSTFYYITTPNFILRIVNKTDRSLTYPFGIDTPIVVLKNDTLHLDFSATNYKKGTILIGDSLQISIKSYEPIHYDTSWGDHSLSDKRFLEQLNFESDHGFSHSQGLVFHKIGTDSTIVLPINLSRFRYKI